MTAIPDGASRHAAGLATPPARAAKLAQLARLVPPPRWLPVDSDTRHEPCVGCRHPVYWTRTPFGRTAVDCDVPEGRRPNHPDTAKHHTGPRSGRGVLHSLLCPAVGA